jgi:hypothetical protein
MDIIKKNIISVICAIIAILAIVASFFPLGGYVEKLQTNLDKSKQNYTTLDTLRTKPRQLPSLSPDSAEQQPLGTFPNPNVINKGKEVVKEVEKQSLGMRDAAVKMNVHAQLSPGTLPNARGPAPFKFRDLYDATLNFGKNGELPRLAQQMKAGMPPTAQDITRALEAMRIEIQEKELVKLPNGQIANQQEVTDRIAQRTLELPDEMRRKAAESSQVYISPDTFDVYPRIAGGRSPEAIDIWWAQVGLWIQQDVAAAIIAANKDAKNVLDAPVKHLVQIRIDPKFISSGAAPAPADPAAADAAITEVPLVSATARASNALYDVVHFNLVVNMEAANVPAFLRELSRNRFITATEVSLHTPQPTANEQVAGFIYGNAPIVTATIRCEALFLRQWTLPLMPAPLKQMLGIPEPGAAPVAPTAGAF